MPLLCSTFCTAWRGTGNTVSTLECCRYTGNGNVTRAAVIQRFSSRTLLRALGLQTLSPIPKFPSLACQVKMWGRMSPSYSSTSSSRDEAAPAAVPGGPAGAEKSSRARALGTKHDSETLGAGTAVGGGHSLAAEQEEQQAEQQLVRFEVCSSGQGGAVVVADGRARVRRPRAQKEPVVPPPRWCSKL